MLSCVHVEASSDVKRDTQFRRGCIVLVLMKLTRKLSELISICKIVSSSPFNFAS